MSLQVLGTHVASWDSFTLRLREKQKSTHEYSKATNSNSKFYQGINTQSHPVVCIELTEVVH